MLQLRARLCISSAAPISSIVASASSAAARPLRSRGRAPPVDERAACFRTAFRSALDACHAGARPKSRPVASVDAEREQQHSESTRTSGTGSRFGGSERVDRVDGPQRRQQPRRAPPTRTAPGSRRAAAAAAGARLAPSAVRTAISFCRDGRARQQQVGDVRARDQQHAADRAEQHEQRGAAAARCTKRVVEGDQAGCPSPSSRDTAGRRRVATVSISACACSSVTPGRRRPTAKMHMVQPDLAAGIDRQRHPDVAARQQRQRRRARCRRRCSRRRSA